MSCSDIETDKIIILNKGENVIASLTRFCIENDIQNAVFNGIGAVEWLRCGYYALREKKYYMKEYDSLMEVVSMTGNVMLKDDRPFIHVHGVFTNTENIAFGGHIEEMRVGVTLEICLDILKSKYSRKLNEDIGLFLIKSNT